MYYFLRKDNYIELVIQVQCKIAMTLNIPYFVGIFYFH